MKMCINKPSRQKKKGCVREGKIKEKNSTEL